MEEHTHGFFLLGRGRKPTLDNSVLLYAVTKIHNSRG